MGASHSRDNLDLPDSDVESEYSEDDYQDAAERTPERSPNSSGSLNSETPSSLNDVEERLRALKLKYPMSSQATPKTPAPNTSSNAVKLYFFRRGTKSIGKWVLSEKLTFYNFIKSFDLDASGGDEDDEWWFLKVGENKIRVKVGPDMQLKALKDQRRVDFLCNGVWALKFFDDIGYDTFTAKYEGCLFENTHQCEANEANKIKIYGKDFIGWANPELADDSMWEDADDAFLKTPQADSQNFREEFEEASNLGIQSLALGALQNSFLVGDSGIQVVKNYSDGIHGKGVYVNFGESSNRRTATSTPKKALLMRGETNMMIMSPSKEGQPHTAGLHQLDIETGKIVSEWKFEKDGTDISMRDITNDSKGAQLDPSGSTFLGLDDNRLCRWDMRDRHGIVQNLDSPALNWTHGHQFSRGTNFQCFASTGDGSIVVGSLDGKIRLYSSNTMRQAKTAFPGLGSPVTHVDVTYDGKWILGTTDTYLILICTLFTDKDGKTKTGFSGRMGSKIAAPRLLKLTPTDWERAGAGKRFQKAQFSWVTENGRQERHLVATVGSFSVIWDFEQVKKSGHECYKSHVGLKSCYCYKIVPKDDCIVESRFMHDKFSASDSPEAPLVIATPMKVSSFSIAPKRSPLSFL